MAKNSNEGQVCVQVEPEVEEALVCQCWSVPESKVRCAMNAGARTVEEVGELCGAGTGCSACSARIERMLRGLPAKCGSGRFDLCRDCGYIGALCSCANARGDG